MKLNRIKRSRWVGIAAWAGVELAWGAVLAVGRVSMPHRTSVCALRAGFLSQLVLAVAAAVAMKPSLHSGDRRGWVHVSMVVAAVCLSSLGWAWGVAAADATLAWPLRVAGMCGVAVWLGCAVALWRFCMRASATRRRRLTGPVDAVVVLGAGLLGRKPGPLLASRVDRGVAVACDPKAGGAPLICTGGQGPDEPCTEAEAMTGYVQRSDVDLEVLQESRAVNTRENLHFSLEILESRGIKQPRIAVVTSDFHVRRTELTVEAIAQQRPVEAVVLGAETPRAARVHSYLREFVALGVWRVRAWLDRYRPW